jgi:hypothetical protein
MYLLFLISWDSLEATTIIIGAVVAVISLLWSLFERLRLDRKKNAIDMINGWNSGSFEASNIIRNQFYKEYRSCNPISKEKVNKIYNYGDSNGIINQENEDIYNAIMLMSSFDSMVFQTDFE